MEVKISLVVGESLPGVCVRGISLVFVLGKSPRCWLLWGISLGWVLWGISMVTCYGESPWHWLLWGISLVLIVGGISLVLVVRGISLVLDAMRNPPDGGW